MPRLLDPKVEGDLLVKVVPVLPEGLSDQEKEAFRELAKLRQRNTGGKA
jgi:DnaJ-class molecular chaperone